tara:strand:- start:745 stop:1380 length:636 start_codon:yes stop_codon:yes gene_type:complete
MTDQIPFKKPVPEYRTVVGGIWSDILNAWNASFEGDGDTSEQRVNIKNLDGPLDKGRLKGFYHKVQLVAGESAGVRLASSTPFRVIKTNAKNLQIRYIAGVTAGTFIDTGALNNLNLLVSDDAPVYYDLFDPITYNEDDVLFAGDDEINTPVMTNGNTNFYIIVTNNTNASIDSMFSVSGANTESYLGGFGLTGTTQLDPTTEMSTYNGFN